MLGKQMQRLSEEVEGKVEEEGRRGREYVEERVRGLWEEVRRR